MYYRKLNWNFRQQAGGFLWWGEIEGNVWGGVQNFFDFGGGFGHKNLKLTNFIDATPLTVLKLKLVLKVVLLLWFEVAKKWHIWNFEKKNTKIAFVFNHPHNFISPLTRETITSFTNSSLVQKNSTPEGEILISWKSVFEIFFSFPQTFQIFLRRELLLSSFKGISTLIFSKIATTTLSLD